MKVNHLNFVKGRESRKMCEKRITFPIYGISLRWKNKL